MSLLTDALRLREGRRSTRAERGPSFPPFRGPRPGRWIAAVLVGCGLVVAGWWKGAWLIEKVEGLAGIAPAKPTPNLLATVPREEPAKTAEVVAAPASTKVAEPTNRERTVPPVGPPALAPAKVPADRQTAGPAQAIISEEGKKRGEILLMDSLVKSVAEKPVGGVAEKVVEGEVPTAAVPEGGLKPMKVELAEEDLIVATPEEREKKRTEVVEEFLRVLKVQGVRLQGAESRILVDGAPIGLGEKVGALGLTLESVEPQKIIFSDASGRKYPKRY